MKLHLQQNAPIKLKELHGILPKKIYETLTGNKLRNNRRQLFKLLVLRDDIADCEKNKQNTARFLQ